MNVSVIKGQFDGHIVLFVVDLFPVNSIQPRTLFDKVKTVYSIPGLFLDQSFDQIDY